MRPAGWAPSCAWSWQGKGWAPSFCLVLAGEGVSVASSFTLLSCGAEQLTKHTHCAVLLQVGAHAGHRLSTSQQGRQTVTSWSSQCNFLVGGTGIALAPYVRISAACELAV